MANNYKSNYHEVKNFLLDIPEVMDRRTKKAMTATLERIGFEVLDLALIYVPRDTTKLAQTGRYSDVTWKGNTAKVTISFGGDGSKVDYAFWVHENLGRGAGSYGKTTPGTGPKYLERAADQVATTENIRTKFLEEMRRTK